MAELKQVKLSQIDPNPFRNLEDWPTIQEKVDEIIQSYEKTGFWDGYMLARPSSGGKYAQAFGHHRLHAAKQLWGPDHKIAIVVSDLSNDEMFSMMCAENSETYGQKFYYAVMQPIAALVTAYAEEIITLGGTAEKGGRYRLAPNFTPASGPLLEGGRYYSNVTVAVYLGWTSSHSRDGIKASNKVDTALAALELIERNILSRNDFLTLSQTQAKTLVDVTRARMRAETANIDATVSVKAQALKKAEKEGDTNTAKALTASIEDLNAKAEAQARRAGKAAGRSVVQDFAPKPTHEVVKDAAPKHEETHAVKTATQIKYDLIAKWEAVCLENDPKWEKSKGASPASKKASRMALLALSARAKARAEEEV